MCCKEIAAEQHLLATPLNTPPPPKKHKNNERRASDVLSEQDIRPVGSNYTEQHHYLDHISEWLGLQVALLSLTHENNRYDEELDVWAVRLLRISSEIIHIDPECSEVPNHCVDAIHHCPSQSRSMDCASLREYRLASSCFGTNPANDCKTGDRSDDAFDSKKPPNLMRWNIMEREAYQPISEVADHEACRNIRRFGQVIWNISEPRPDGIDHGF